MGRKDGLTRFLAVIGTLLIWLTVLSPVALSAAELVGGGRLLFDFLLPAELFPVAFVGGALLLWAALRARSRHEVIFWGLAVAGGVLVAGMALASATGLASGATEPTGLPWALVTASLAAYVVALVVAGIAGLVLLRDLFVTAGN